MKKLVVMIICILTWAVVASAANNVPGSVGAPQNFSVSLIDAEQVCFSWTPVIDPVPAVKYSLELTVDGIHEFDFEVVIMTLTLQPTRSSCASQGLTLPKT